METQLEYKTYRRKLCGIAAILGLSVATLRFAVARLEFIVLSDVLLADSLLAAIFPLLQTLLTLFTFALFYSFSSVLIGEFGFLKAIPFLFLSVGVTLYRTGLTLVGKLLIDRVSEYEFMVATLPLQLFSLAIELAQYLIVLLVILLVIRLTASIKRSLLFSSLTVLLFKVISRVIYDIGLGLPTSGREVLQMVVGYTSDIVLYGALLFLAMRLLAAWAQKSALPKKL